ncbi:NADPH dehydrogenase-like [Oppia nitens]|uniref:NADPH dehydrogenase-like n=1 Tax=Oppia nitens TaxID=1686743 RepID=UPI0023DBBC01|nr:NADPH dehydrogenase-like [Oppia nitens]
MTTDSKQPQPVVSKLFEPLTIKGTTFKNRIGVSPMGTWMAGEDGLPLDFHLAHYGQFALGGAGLVVCEATAVEPRGRISLADTGLWSDQQVEPWSRITRLLRSQGCVPGIQLGHAGRKASTTPESRSYQSLATSQGGWDTVGPTAMAFSQQMKVPIAATVGDLEVIGDAFASAAQRAVRAGFEFIELHFAHGYLVSTFLSPLTNQRQDKYGGSLENRMRFGLEIVDKVRTAIPNHIVLAVRISFTDYTDNGWELKQSVEFSKQLKELGVDLVDVSSGGVVNNIDYSPLNTARQQHSASAVIQRESGLLTAAVGKIIDPILAERLLKDNVSTFVFIGRAFLNEPHWPYRASDLLKDRSFKYPPTYDWCIGWTAYFKWRNMLYTDKNNIDLVDVSSGGVVNNIDYSPLNTARQQHSASAVIQRESGLPTIAVGKIIDTMLAERLLKDNSATFIFIGRAFLNEPHWPYRASDLLQDQSFKYPPIV